VTGRHKYSSMTKLRKFKHRCCSNSRQCTGTRRTHSTCRQVSRNKTVSASKKHHSGMQEYYSDFTRCFSYFSLDCLYFFFPFHVTSCGFELRLILFFASSFTIFFMFSQFFVFWFAQYCLSKIPLLCMGESDKAPTNKIYRRASSEQHPRTRSCHESERLFRPFLGQTYLLESLFFRSSSRAAGDFSQRRLENSLSS